MSWEIYVFAYQDGEPCEFDTADLRAIFERGALPHPPWPPQNTDYLYDDGHIRMDIGSHGPRSKGFVAYRIFGQTAIARLLEAAKSFRCLICWPGDPPLAVASQATLAHVPQMTLDDTYPVVTETPEAFIEAVGFSSKMTKEDWIEATAKYNRWYDQYERNYRPR